MLFLLLNCIGLLLGVALLLPAVLEVLTNMLAE